MTDKTPTIVATSGGWRYGRRVRMVPGPLLHLAVELSGVDGRRPKVAYLGTAGGDQAAFNSYVTEGGQSVGWEFTCLNLFPMPNQADMEAYLLDQDVVWVGGGSVAGLLAMWRLHGLDEIFRRVWEAGVVLSGVSAGSLCWHLGGTTDSFGPELRPVTNGLGLLPFSNGVHYDSEEQRRPLYQQLVADGELPAGYATDDGVGLVYRGTELVEAVTEVTGKGAYHVEEVDGKAVETRIEPRILTDGAA